MAYPVVYALHDFETNTSDEIPFRAGDAIRVLESDGNEYEEGWWNGINPEGATGLFPLAFTTNDRNAAMGHKAAVESTAAAAVAAAAAAASVPASKAGHLDTTGGASVSGDPVSFSAAPRAKTLPMQDTAVPQEPSAVFGSAQGLGEDGTKTTATNLQSQIPLGAPGRGSSSSRVSSIPTGINAPGKRPSGRPAPTSPSTFSGHPLPPRPLSKTSGPANLAPTQLDHSFGGRTSTASDAFTTDDEREHKKGHLGESAAATRSALAANAHRHLQATKERQHKSDQQRTERAIGLHKRDEEQRAGNLLTHGRESMSIDDSIRPSLSFEPIDPGDEQDEDPSLLPSTLSERDIRASDPYGKQSPPLPPSQAPAFIPQSQSFLSRGHLETEQLRASKTGSVPPAGATAGLSNRTTHATSSPRSAVSVRPSSVGSFVQDREPTIYPHSTSGHRRSPSNTATIPEQSAKSFASRSETTPTTAASLALPSDPADWSVSQVCQWARSKGWDEASVVSHFAEQEISGDVLLDLDINMLKEIGIHAFGPRHRIAMAIRDLRRFETAEGKRYASSIEDHVYTSPAPSTSGPHSTSGREGPPLDTRLRGPEHPSELSQSAPSRSLPLSQDVSQQVRTPWSESSTRPQAPDSALAAAQAPVPLHPSQEPVPSTARYEQTSAPGRRTRSVLSSSGPQSSAQSAIPPASESASAPAPVLAPVAAPMVKNSSQPGPLSTCGKNPSFKNEKRLSSASVSAQPLTFDPFTPEHRKQSQAQMQSSPFTPPLTATVAEPKSSTPPPGPYATTPPRTESRLLSAHGPKPSTELPADLPEWARREAEAEQAVAMEHEHRAGVGVAPVALSTEPARPTITDDMFASPPPSASHATPSPGRMFSRRRDKKSALRLGGSWANDKSLARFLPKRLNSSATDGAEESKSGVQSNGKTDDMNTLRSEETAPAGPGVGGAGDAGGGDVGVVSQQAASEPILSVMDRIRPVDYEGWLAKKGDLYGAWKPRYLAVKGSDLVFLQDPEATKIKGYVPLRGVRILSSESIHPGSYGLQIVHDGPYDVDNKHKQVHSFSSDDPVVVRHWIHVLTKASIVRDGALPVVSSYQARTIPLSEAQAMDPPPRPPSPTTLSRTQKATARNQHDQLSQYQRVLAS